MQYSEVSDNILSICKDASQLILQYVNKQEVERKDDNSPVTNADVAANEFIVNKLKELTPNIPIIAEESANTPFTDQERDQAFWLVDPLDGTKSFIRGEPYYTVNIALIENRVPKGGAVVAPAMNDAYFVGTDGKAYKQHANQDATVISVRDIPQEGITLVASNFHRSGQVDQLIQSIQGLHEVKTISSSIKFCLVAEGVADIYPRFGPTMEWDTAAGHAILLAAGGKMVTMQGTEFCYAKDEFRNGGFMVSSCATYENAKSLIA